MSGPAAVAAHAAARATAEPPHLVVERPLSGLVHGTRLAVSGWAEAAGAPCVVEVRRDGELVASALADIPRPDLDLQRIDAGGFRFDLDLADRLPMWIDVQVTARAPDGGQTTVTIPCRREVDSRALRGRVEEVVPLLWLHSEGIVEDVADEWIRLHGCVVDRDGRGELEAIVDGERTTLVTEPVERGALGIDHAAAVAVRSFRHTIDLRGYDGRVTLSLELDGVPLGRAALLIDPFRAAREALAAAEAMGDATAAGPEGARLREARAVVVVPAGAEADIEAVRTAVASLAAQSGVRWEQPPQAVPGARLPDLLRRNGDGRALPLVCCDPGDQLMAGAAARLLDALEGAAVAYGDEIDSSGRLLRRPGWSPELALSVDTTGGLVALRADHAAALAQDDVTSIAALLAGGVDADVDVVRLPQVLRQRTRSHAAVVPEGRRQRVARARGLSLNTAPVPGPPGACRLRWADDMEHAVAVVIPSTGRPDLLPECLRRLSTATGVSLEIVVVDSGCCCAATLAATPGLPAVRVVPYDRATFNFSRACNLGWRATSARNVLFLNDDIESPSGDWAASMAGWACVPAIGAVGARLLLPNGALQHDGVSIDVAAGVSANEVERGRSAASTGFADLAFLARDRSAVTGAALMVPRAALEALGGWEEQLPIDFGDVDLCLQIRTRLGLRVIVDPAVELVHHLSATRSRIGDVGDHSVFAKRWASTLVREGDRWTHPAFVVGSDHVLR